MNRILEIDGDNHVAVVQPGVTLEELDEETSRHDLVYPVFPGENRRRSAAMSPPTPGGCGPSSTG